MTIPLRREVSPSPEATAAAENRDIPPPQTYDATPQRIYRREVANARLANVAALRDSLTSPALEVISAYSFKTNPRAEMVAAARDHGFHAETISHDELEWAKHHGFALGATIYNGPEPMLDKAEGSRIGIAFADSVEAFVRNCGRGVAHVHGARLRPSMVTSRFGMPLEDDRALANAAASIEPGKPFAVSFHARHSDFKGATWRDVAADVLDRAARLQAATRRPVVAFDVGGGWTPDEFDAKFEPDMRWLIHCIREALPNCRRLIFEAGQAVCTPVEALLTEVLELRERGGRREAIVDVGYSDWPEMNSYVHGLYVWRDGLWQAFGRGPDRLLGRTCLEYDMVEGLRFPPDLHEGDRILIADTGSYDHAMSFDFARGGERHATLSD